MRIWLLAILAFCATVGEETGDIVDLYDRDAAVAHMSLANFRQLLHNKAHIWAVEFYNSWCGKCQRYAPTWLSIAQQTAKWHQVVRVGAINCIRPEHLDICRSYNVSRYPHVRFFKPFVKEGDIGEKMDHKQLYEMLGVIVHYATNVQVQAHPPNWPNMAAFEGSLSDLLASPEPLHALVVDGTANSTVGRQVVLDLSGQRQRLRLVRSVLPLDGLQVTNAARPLLVTFKNGQRQPDLFSRDGLPPRKLFSDALRRALGLSDEEAEPSDSKTSRKDTKQAAVGRTAAASGGDAVFMVDLENAVGYALRQEVSGKKEISGESLSALRNFVEVLIKYLPGRKSVLEAVGELKTLLKGRKKISGAKVQRHLEKAKHQLPAHRPWRGCRGSKPQYRGYTCGLWSLFHTLTVHAHELSDTNKHVILPAIHGYVKHFFSCSHCSQHFQEMAAKEGLFNITHTDQAMVWLWRAHNIVNKRLAGDLTEDPQHPKVQFPTRTQCPACFSGEDYFEPIIVSFLHSFYGKAVMKLDGLTEDEAAAAAASGGLQPVAPATGRPRNRAEQVARVLDGHRGADAVRSIPAGLFSVSDISLCVLLWSFSFITLVLAFFLFRMKRSYKRKHSKDYRSFFR